MQPLFFILCYANMQKYDIMVCPTERKKQAMKQAVNLVLNLTGMGSGAQ